MARQVPKPPSVPPPDQRGDPVQWLASLLRRHVGHYIRGSQLPSRAELARQFGVTLRQARQAVQVLVDEGLVESRPRGGTFVTAEAASAVGIRRVIAIVQFLPPPQVFQQAVLLGADRECAARQLPFGVVGLPAAGAPVPTESGLKPPDLERSDCLAELAGAPALEGHASSWPRTRQSGSRLQTRPVAFGDLSLQGRSGNPLQVGWMFVNLLPPARSLLDWRIGGVPLVLVDEASAEQPTHTVCPDVQGAIFRAAESLALLGHRRIAYVGSFSDDGIISASRIRGFLAAIQRYGLAEAPVDESLLWDDGAGESPATRRMLRERLSAERGPPIPTSRDWGPRPARPTGVVAANQRIGCDLLAVCDELDLAVPAELSVICGGMERRELPEELVGRLSCWSTGRPEELGRLAVDLLARAHEVPGPVNLLAGCTWQDRGSTGPPPGR